MHKIPPSPGYIVLGAALLVVAFIALQIIYGLEELISGQSIPFDWSQLLIQNPRAHWVSIVVRFGILFAVVLWSRRTINAVHRDRELVRQIPETVADGIYLVDRDGRMTFANTAVEKILGLPRDVILHRTYDDPNWNTTTLDGKPFPKEEQPFVRVMSTGQPVSGVEQSIERPDGKRVIVSVNAAPIRDAQGRVVAEVGTLTDISERKRAEATLRHVERRYRRLFEGVSVMNVVTRHAKEGAVIVDCSDLFARRLGYARAEIIGRPLGDFYGEESRRKLYDGGYDRALRGEFEAEERELIAKNGSLVNFLVSAVPDTDDDGNTVGTLSVYMDISDRKRAEAALRESEDRYRELYEKAPIAYYSIDAANGKIRIANQSMAEMLGYHVDDLIGRSIFDIYPDTQAAKEKVQEIFVRFRQGIETRGEEVQMQRSDGSLIWVNLSVRPERDANGNVVYSRATAVDISERVHAEAALRHVERRYRRLFEGVSTMNVLTKPGADGLPIIIDCNDLFSETLGYTRAEVVGRPAGEFYTEESRKKMSAGGYERSMRGQLLTEERELLTKDGNIVSTLVTAVPDTDENGQPIGSQAGYVDITQRKYAEEALDKERRLLRTLLDNLPDYIYTKDTEGRFTLANAAMAHLQGATSPEDLVGKTDFDFVPADLAQHYRSVDQAIISTGEPLLGHQERNVDGDGKPRWVMTSKVPLHDSKGNVVGLVGISHDITQYHQTQEALRQSEARQRALLEALPDSIWHMTSDGVLLDYKPSKDLLPALDLDQYIGRHVDQVSSFPATDQLLHHTKQAMATGETCKFEYQIQNGIDTYDRQARVVRCGDDEAMMIVSDITDRKRVDRLKNEFISMVSHELRTPLTSIRGSLGLIAAGTAGKVSAQAQSLVDIAYKNSERLIRLINDILDIEKIESGKMVFELKPIELMPLVNQAIEANIAYGHQFGVEFAIESELPDARVNADSDRLTQVLTNLLSNAAKFSPRGSTVDVGVARHNSTLRVSVSDHGSGIPEEFRSRMFQKFAQADSSTTRQKGGTGLGLNISKAIVERLGGQIGFETEPDTGTTFYFDLPEWHADTKKLKPFSAHKPRVLICEDDHDTAMLLKLMLEQSGYAPEIAYGAMEAKEMLLQNDYAGMTLDLVLPDEDGISLIRELRGQDRTRDLSIVVVSMSAEKGRSELNGDAVQVIDWISKPIDPTRLLNAVKQAVARAPSRPARILHVEDDPDILEVVSVILGNIAQLDRATTLSTARRLLRETRYDLVILDLEMPDGSGVDLLPWLREHEPVVPAVIFSVGEVKKETAAMVSATLVKSRTSNEKLVQTIQSLIRTPIAA